MQIIPGGGGGGVKDNSELIVYDISMCTYSCSQHNIHMFLSA